MKRVTLKSALGAMCSLLALATTWPTAARAQISELLLDRPLNISGVIVDSKLPVLPQASQQEQLLAKVAQNSEIQPEKARTLWAALVKFNSIDFAASHSDLEISVFVDPRCPYCAQFFSNWKAMVNKPALHVYLFPHLGKRSTELASAIASLPSNTQRANALMLAFDADLSHKELLASEFGLSQEQGEQSEKHLNQFKEALLNSGIPIQGVPVAFLKTKDLRTFRINGVFDPHYLNQALAVGDPTTYLLQYKELSKP